MSSPASETLLPLSDGAALLMRPGSAMSRFEVHNVNAAELENLNLRTLGWANEYLFAKRQATLDNLRVIARRRPLKVIRPRPFCEVVLLEIA